MLIFNDQKLSPLLIHDLCYFSMTKLLSSKDNTISFNFDKIMEMVSMNKSDDFDEPIKSKETSCFIKLSLSSNWIKYPNMKPFSD